MPRETADILLLPTLIEAGQTLETKLYNLYDASVIHFGLRQVWEETDSTTGLQVIQHYGFACPGETADYYGGPDGTDDLFDFDTETDVSSSIVQPAISTATPTTKSFWVGNRELMTQKGWLEIINQDPTNSVTVDVKLEKAQWLM